MLQWLKSLFLVWGWNNNNYYEIQIIKYWMDQDLREVCPADFEYLKKSEKSLQNKGRCHIPP